MAYICATAMHAVEIEHCGGAQQEIERAKHFRVRSELVSSTHTLTKVGTDICVHMGACVTAYSPVIDQRWY